VATAARMPRRPATVDRQGSTMTRNIDSSGFEQGGGGERRRERRWSLWSVRAVVVDAIDR
jgi:hypothetical protein